MATPGGKSGVEIMFQATLPSAIADNATREYPLGQNHREIRFREAWFIAGQTVASGIPATNHCVVQIWNFTDSTKIAQATLAGVGGTNVQRFVKKSIATTAQFTAGLSEASANKVFTARFVTTNTLVRDLRKPQLVVIADAID